MSRWIISLVVCVAVLMGAVDMAQAEPVSKETAMQLVQGWINSSSKPLGNQIDRAETVSTAEGQTLYYVVYLDPQGYVVVSADDSIEPIICFSAGSHLDLGGPLGLMLGNDLQTRQDVVDSITRILEQQASGQNTLRSSASAATVANLQAVITDSRWKWRDLLAKAKDPAMLRTPVKLQSANINRRKVVLDQEPASVPVADASTGYAPQGFDVWIDPLIRSAWNESKILNYSWAANLYNISTPSNRPAGCVAVAMAQLMRYHAYPAGIALGATSNYYELNNAGDPNDTNIIWANYIGTYTNLDSELAITNMPLDPPSTLTPTGPATVEWSNIAALVFDAGLSVNTAYGTNRSGALNSKIVPALTNTFGYTNAIYASTSNNFTAIITRNLMGSKPVLLNIRSSGVTNSGHVAIVDGFAFSAQATIFYHLNLGWGEIGESTAWYNLPTVIAYNTIDGFEYNIFPTNSGELIVGRVTNSLGGGVSGVIVSAGGVTNTTDSRGFFGVIVARNTTNTLTAVKQGYLTTVASNIVVGTSSGNTNGGVLTWVNIVQGPAFALTAGTYSTNVLLEWTNPTNATYTGLAHILWTTNTPQEWDTWSAPTGAIFDGVADAENTITNEYPTNHVVSEGSLGGAASTLSFVHSNLTLGMTYYYKVWLTNSSGWVMPDTPGSVLTAQATPDSGTLTMYFQDNSASRLVKCLKFTPTNTVKLNTTVASTNMVAYNIAAVGDFDSDDVDDILFQRNTGTNAAPNLLSASNSWYVWFMQPSGKLKSDQLVNTNDLTSAGTYIVRGVSAKGTNEAMIITRAASGTILSFSATNGVIDASITNFTGGIQVNSATGWLSSIGVTSH